MELKRIKELRELNFIKQSEIAKILGVAQNSYSNYENGGRTIPYDALIRLADYYNVSVDYLLGITDSIDCYPRNDFFKEIILRRR